MCSHSQLATLWSPSHARPHPRPPPLPRLEVCDLVAHGASVEEAADTINVSVRTVQREAKEDEDFDHELKLALGAAPDPLKLMQGAARAHWRAAAWLLERTDPEHYAKRPASSASPEQFEAALTVVLEAALEATPPEQRAAVYAHVQAACDEAFKCVFPNYGPWGRPKNPQLPPTPLADDQQLKRFRNPSSRHQVLDDVTTMESSPAPKPVDRPMQPRPLAGGRFASKEGVDACTATPGQRPGLKETPPAAPRLPWQFHLRTAQSALSIIPRAATSASLFGKRILSPKMRFATEFEASRQAADEASGMNGCCPPNADPANERTMQTPSRDREDGPQRRSSENNACGDSRTPVT